MRRLRFQDLLLCVVLLGCFSAVLSRAAAQTDPPIAVGEIDQIHNIDKLFVLKTLAGTDDGDAGRIGGVRIGVGGGGIGRLPSPIPIPGGPDAGTIAGGDSAYRYITVRAATAAVIDDGGAYIPFERLRRGDEVTIRGRPFGDDIEASEIIRLPED